MGSARSLHELNPAGGPNVAPEQVQQRPIQLHGVRHGAAQPQSSYMGETGLVQPQPGLAGEEEPSSDPKAAMQGEGHGPDLTLHVGLGILAVGKGGRINCYCSPTTTFPLSFRTPVG